MGPRDRPRPLPDGAPCTACGAPVPTGRIRILARRDDLAFVELDCAACGSAALGLLLDRPAADGEPILDVAGRSGPPAVARVGAARPRRSRRPTSTPIRDDLAAWDGDLVGWLDALERADRLGSVVDSVSAPFAHASEAEMSRILDFYAVRWEYEPHTFPILWNLDGDVVESFSPDFYLPDLDLYLEMTTLRQKLVRKKNRKLRRLRELYPDLNVKLFYARDFRALMLKYGKLALFEGLSGTSGQVARRTALTAELEAAPDAPLDPTPAGAPDRPAATTARRRRARRRSERRPPADARRTSATSPRPAGDRPMTA